MSVGKSCVEARIRQHRTAEAVVTVRDANGSPLANTEVAVRQTQHRFLFGCNLFMLNTHDESDAQHAYQSLFADLLNFATLPFYWGS